MRRAAATAAILAAGWFSWGSAASQVLHDPTEPPSAGPLSASAASAGAGTTLQSVIVSEGRKLAMIDGRMYRAGDKVGDATVMAISANEVTLRGPQGVKVLKLYASLKKPAAGAQPGPAGGKGGP